jgi:hypothetical protein
VAPDVTASELAAELRALLDDERRRRLLSSAARAYAEAHTFDAAGEALYRLASSSD